MAEIELSADMSTLNVALDFLRQHIPSPTMLTWVELVCEELFVNIVQYAYDNRGGEMRLGCKTVNMDGERQFCVWFKDWGKPYDLFAETEAPDLDQPLDSRKVGGLGVHLVKHICRHYCYCGDDGSNNVEIYFIVEKD